MPMRLQEGAIAPLDSTSIDRFHARAGAEAGREGPALRGS